MSYQFLEFCVFTLTSVGTFLEEVLVDFLCGSPIPLCEVCSFSAIPSFFLLPEFVVVSPFYSAPVVIYEEDCIQSAECD